jgi:hypothetical protein
MDEKNFTKLWDSLYIITRCFKPSKQEDCIAFYNFFESFKFLLPNPKLRYLLMVYMDNVPITQCDRDFNVRWVIGLNNYMCRFTRTIIQDDYNTICKKYNPSKITKTQWGNSLWYLIHYIAIHQPTILTQEIAYSFKVMMECLTYLLPCDICKGHLKQHLQNFPIYNYLRTNESVFEWTFILHNKVNMSLNKPVLNYKDARDLYI